MDLHAITRALSRTLGMLRFEEPVAYVYNPLEYAAKPYGQYIDRYGDAPREVIFVGMNPGPWGMAQTGVPFGEISMVRDWMGIAAPVGKPPREHPKRPIDGFDCTRSEPSGRRLWGWAKQRFETPGNFFSRFFVVNYCPLLFFSESGTNLTPDKLPVAQRRPLLEACDQALTQTIAYLRPRFVIGVGAFAEKQIRSAAGEQNVAIGRIMHPSPANPRANRGWSVTIEKELTEIGIAL